MTEKSVLFVISTLNTGGAQKVISNMIMGLPDDWEIGILLNDSNDIRYPYKGELYDLGLKPQLDKNKIGYQLKVFLKRQKKLRELKKLGYKNCVSALTSANIVNILTRCNGCKSFATVHSYMSSDAKANGKLVGIISKILIKLFYNKADYVVGVSKAICDDLNAHFGIKSQKLIAIPNGYPLTHIKELSNEKLSVEEEAIFNDKTIVTVGRLCYAKGYFNLIRAMQKVVVRQPDAKLLIVGDGEQRKEHEALIKNCGLEKNVFLIGFVSNPYKYMKHGKIYVLSSIYEGFPNVLIEALAVGKPCICTSFGNVIDEIVPSNMKEGLVLTEPFDGSERWGETTIKDEEAGMADAIINLLENDEVCEKMGNVAEKIAEPFDMSNIIKRWEVLFLSQD